MGRRMYSDYFGITENAFSITPDPRYLFMSERHCEALAHLLYGVVESGCFVLLTGEVGTGKTTVCRTLLEQLPDNVDVALLLNPPRSGRELLSAIIDELRIPFRYRDATLRELVDHLNKRLLESHGQGRRTVVIIDEAQNIPPEVLEQVRLLTNLETHTEKLLQVFLVGQPELRQQLINPALRQVAQRITARYHLEPLSPTETVDYVHHRLAVAGCRQGLFSAGALRQLHRESQGVPRVINILCDRALLAAFASDAAQVSDRMIHKVAKEWRGEFKSVSTGRIWKLRILPLSAVGLTFAAALVFAYSGEWPRGLAVNDQGKNYVKPVTTQPEIASHEAMQQKSHEEVQISKPESVTVPYASRDASNTERSLLKLWSIETTTTNGSLCSIANRHGLECLRAGGDWNTLLRYNRPAVLTFVQGDNVTYGLLVALNNDNATLKSEQQTITLPKDELVRVWNGEFLLLWKPVRQDIHMIGQDSPPELVRWLWNELNRIDGISAADTPVQFDDQLRDRVKALQRKHGLMEDGIVGPQTLRYIQAVDSLPGYPTLIPQPPLS